MFGGAASLAVACVRAEPVKGPDGETAHNIRCYDSTQCYAKAHEICPDGYVIRTHGQNVYATYSYGRPGGYAQTEMLVSCKADLPDRSWESNAPVPPPAWTQTEREDARVCEAGYAEVAGFAKYWATTSLNAKPLDDLPLESDFVSTCHEMPDAVQRCMHDKYRVAHAARCEATLSRLTPTLRNKIDALFLQAVKREPAAPPPNAPSGGTT
jgi:hypothetical protein